MIWTTVENKIKTLILLHEVDWTYTPKVLYTEPSPASIILHQQETVNKRIRFTFFLSVLGVT